MLAKDDKEYNFEVWTVGYYLTRSGKLAIVNEVDIGTTNSRYNNQYQSYVAVKGTINGKSENWSLKGRVNSTSENDNDLIDYFSGDISEFFNLKEMFDV